MQRTTLGALMTSALFLAGCGGSGSFAPHTAGQTASHAVARQYRSVAEGVASGALKPVCGPVAAGRARCTAYIVVQAAAPAGPAVQSDAAPVAPPPGLGPADLQSAYALTAAARSKGGDATIAIVDAFDSPQAEQDLAVYRARYGLKPCTTANHCFKKVNQNGAAGPLPPVEPQDFGWPLETALDLEMVSANCPKCNIVLVETNDDFMNNLAQGVNAAARLSPTAISNSYVSQEAPTDPGPTGPDALLPSYVHPGIAVVAGNGDFGYMTNVDAWDGAEYIPFGPAIPAAFPSVVAVGGTELVPNSTVARGWSESVWSATGSGCSAYEPAPPWQRPDPNCVGTYTDSHGKTSTFPSRVYGDVAYAADNVAMYSAAYGGWFTIAGTSIGAPSIAAIYGLAGYGSKHDGAGDFPAQALYASRGSLFDVTIGNNYTGYAACTDTYLCNAGPGYDGPSGNGSPNGVGAF
jgi:subtilase family serine protease